MSLTAKVKEAKFSFLNEKPYNKTVTEHKNSLVTSRIQIK